MTEKGTKVRNAKLKEAAPADSYFITVVFSTCKSLQDYYSKKDKSASFASKSTALSMINFDFKAS